MHYIAQQLFIVGLAPFRNAEVAALARKLELLVLGLVVAPIPGDSIRLRRSLFLSMWSLTFNDSFEMCVGTWLHLFDILVESFFAFFS